MKWMVNFEDYVEYCTLSEVYSACVVYEQWTMVSCYCSFCKNKQAVTTTQQNPYKNLGPH